MLLSQKPFRGVQLNRTHPLAKGLVGCWLFNELTGETAFDLSGNGNNGILKNGIAWGGNGLEFDGVDDYVEIPSIVLSGSGSSITISFNFDAFVSQLVGKNSNANTYIHLKQADEIRVQTDVTGTYKDFTVPNMAVGNWYDLIVTRNNNVTRLYLDGVESTSGGQSQSDDLTIDQMGRYKNGTSGYWYNGSFRSVDIYNRALSAEEIAWLHREPYAMFEPAFNPALLYSAAAAGVPNAGALMMAMI